MGTERELDLPAVRDQLITWLSAAVELQRASQPSKTGWSFCCIEELVLACGSWGIPAALPPDRARGGQGTCYANASSYGERHGLAYVEGFALSPAGLVYAHAWCVDQDLYVHDPTWPDQGGLAYLGVPFTREYIAAFDQRFGNKRLVHDAHIDGFRILREGFPPGATAVLRPR